MSAIHPIRRHLDATGISQSEFARRVACSDSYLSLILRDLRGVSLELAQRIERETGGAVRAAELRCRPVQAQPAPERAAVTP